MILDHLSRAARYHQAAPGLTAAFEFLRTLDVAKLVDGRNPIDGDRLFAMLNRYRTKPHAQAVWESHRKYLDVQYVVSGSEWMGYVPLDRAPAIKTPYDAVRDVQFYEPCSDGFVMTAGQFAVFYPEDIHAPGLMAGRAVDVVKIVVKVAVG
jgi:biofilm protein TabA